jgi:hypothetical protein
MERPRERRDLLSRASLEDSAATSVETRLSRPRPITLLRSVTASQSQRSSGTRLPSAGLHTSATGRQPDPGRHRPRALAVELIMELGRIRVAASVAGTRRGSSSAGHVAGDDGDRGHLGDHGPAEGRPRLRPAHVGDGRGDQSLPVGQVAGSRRVGRQARHTPTHLGQPIYPVLTHLRCGHHRGQGTSRPFQTRSESCTGREVAVGSLTTALVLLAAAAGIAFQGSSRSRSDNGRADEVHLSWVGSPETTMAINWHTASRTSSAVIIEEGDRWRRTGPFRLTATTRPRSVP